MSKEIETTVDALLASYGVSMTSVYKGVEKNALGGKWEMDRWSVAFTKGDGREAFEEFDYFTGTGHRSKVEDTPAGAHAAKGLRNANRNCLAWEDLRKKYCKPVTLRIIQAPDYGAVQRIQMQVVDGYGAGNILPHIWPKQNIEHAIAWAEDTGYLLDKESYDQLPRTN